MPAIHLYFRKQPIGYKWIPGDKYLINLFRNLFQKKRISGIEKVFINLCKGFDRLNVDYKVNQPFKKIKPDEAVVILGNGTYALSGYTQPNKIIAGIGLMTHPYEWPNLFQEYPIARYLQHAAWTNNIYIAYYGKANCTQWPAGIDTEHWQPGHEALKQTDFLIYNKIMWNKPDINIQLRHPILNQLHQLGLTYKEITYGHYNEAEYYEALKSSRAMIFLCEHESQGFACCEAMSMNVPVFAWDQGFWLDPNRFKWNDPVVPATSVPFFDHRCGMTFTNFEDFEKIGRAHV